METNRIITSGKSHQYPETFLPLQLLPSSLLQMETSAVLPREQNTTTFPSAASDPRFQSSKEWNVCLNEGKGFLSLPSQGPATERDPLQKGQSRRLQPCPSRVCLVVVVVNEKQLWQVEGVSGGIGCLTCPPWLFFPLKIPSLRVIISNSSASVS